MNLMRSKPCLQTFITHTWGKPCSHCWSPYSALAKHVAYGYCATRMTAFSTEGGLNISTSLRALSRQVHPVQTYHGMQEALATVVTVARKYVLHCSKRNKEKVIPFKAPFKSPI